VALSPVTRLERAAAERSAAVVSVAEKAVLVAVEISGGRRSIPAAAQMARSAALLLNEEEEAVPRKPAVPADVDFESSLAEFEELARSAGAYIAATVIQRRGRPDPATLIGVGKVEEVVAIAESTGADVVLFDHDLSPTQLRNLEKKMPCRVIDRTQLILDIFARHARTREGHLQVELAQLEYQLPRMAGKGQGLSQQGGGIGTRGPGETRIETDRRVIRGRIDHVKKQLEQVRRIRRQQRQRRESVPVPTVALVGYTNAGKSTLFNALTEAGVLASSRMFATLDPKLRQLALPGRRKVLLSDTVGFIRNLPHALVTSFRATLEEVERAELLLHVRDASSPLLEEQKQQVEAVLAELEVQKTPRIEVLNKIDLLSAPEQEALLGRKDVVAISAAKKIGMDALIAAIEERIGGEQAPDPTAKAEFRIPQREGRTIAALEAGCFVDSKRFEGSSVVMEVRGPTSLLNRYRRFQATDVAKPEVGPVARPRRRVRKVVPA